MTRDTPRNRVAFTIAAALTLSLFVALNAQGQMVLKTENFNVDPGWSGRSNRAQSPPARSITQNFGFSSLTINAGGPAGEVGGLITPAGEGAYYAKSIPVQSFNDTLFASGSLSVRDQGHTLLGFFNSNTINEWRTPNAISLRLYGRETHFEAYIEYGTSKWRAEGKVFPITFAPGPARHSWSLQYDPNANSGRGAVTGTIGNQTIVTNLEPGHKLDGATFDQFGLLNVIKSADGAGQVWVDNVNINGATETFSTNPNWTAFNNKRTYNTTNVRLRFDFGYSATNHAGGASAGEIGGHTFRGDSSGPSGVAYYGDALQQTLTFDHPLHASGKVSFRRGVSDSTTLLGFFHSTDSVRVAPQGTVIPENFVGVGIEGPSAEGFHFYPAYGTNQEGVASNERGTNPPYIYPDGTSQNWTMDYDPTIGAGRISVTLDGQLVTYDLDPGHRAIGAHFDRFGIITTHRDGNGQTVYFDDLTYTIGVPEPTGAAAVILLAALRDAARATDLTKEPANAMQQT